MSRRGAAVSVLVVAALLITSAVALPLLGDGLVPIGEGESEDGGADGQTTDIDTGDGSSASESDADADAADPVQASSIRPTAEPNVDLISMESPTTDADADANSDADASGSAEADVTASLAQEQQDAVEAGVEEGIQLAQSQGVEVSQEQRAAALEGASQSVAQQQAADVEQVQAATAGAVHGSLLQSQDVEVEQFQSAIGGATGGALAQSQTVSASQMQSATWGATHGALAQKQRADVEQIQVATRGAAAGACREAAESDVEEEPKIQEAAQGSAYGVLEQYQKITVEQRQRITLDHVQNAAAGASAGAVEGSTEAALEQEQTIEVEQRQRVDLKQVQKAATGAAKGALVQRQSVTVEQTQSAARGASKGSLTQVQTVSVEQVQRISITQIQEASFGAAKGSIYQSQEATVEQIQAAATGAAGGVLVQRQEISITQIQYAAVGAAEGTIESAVQYQTVEIEQLQAAAFGAGEGAVIQKQVVDVTQVQRLAAGGASGSLTQFQEATVEQIQIAASSACQETARVVQYQRISVTQIQILTQETASDGVAYAVQQETADASQIGEFVREEADEGAEEIDEREGTATVAFDDQESDGETVTVDEVELSEGGFVAIYAGDAVADPAAVIGTSGYLEAGTYTDLEIDLEEPREDDRSLVAVVHHDTNGDAAFDYAESDGAEDDPYVTGAGAPVLDTGFVTVGEEPDEPDEPDEPNESAEPNATLSVSDQDGDGETLAVDEASATVGYTVTATANGSAAESQAFDANETATDLELDLEPPLEESATVDVAIVDENGTELANETVEYAVDAPTEPEPTLEVSDQTGDGENLTVDEANASEEYTVAVTDESGQQLAASETFAAGETASNLTLTLEPPLEENATLGVAVVGEDGAELANETIAYTVAEAADEPTATLEVGDQTGDGENLTVEAANASVDYALTVTDEDGQQRAASETFAAGETASNLTLPLEPPLEENATLEVSVVDEADAELANETIEYTVEEETEPFEAQFLDCQRAEVTGSFAEGDGIIVATGFYESGGFGNSMGEYGITVGEDVAAPFEGTITYETGDEFTVEETADGATVTVPEGDFGAAITGFASPEATPGEIDHPNPNASACIEEVRPEPPEITVEEATPTDDGIAVTFGYDNPNDAPLLVDSEFVQGTTDDDPVAELEPGSGTFTVDWTPQSDDERLVWEVDLSGYDYEEPLTAETATAGEIDPSEPAEFVVEIPEEPAAVEQGEPLEVDAVIENVGGEAATQDVDLTIDGAVVDTSAVSLEPGATGEVTLTAATDALDPGTYSAAVSSENDTAETTVTVEDAGESEFAVTGLDAPASGEPGEAVTVTATIENAGDLEGTQTLQYSIDGEVVAEQSLDLAAGQAATVSFSPTLPEGASTHTVATEDDQASVTIEAVESDPVTEDGPSGQEDGPPGQDGGPPGQEDGPPGQEGGPPGQGDGPPGQGPPGQDGPPEQAQSG